MLVSAQVDQGFRNIDYDPRALRKPLRAAGNEVRKIARTLIARRAVSEAGQYPGKQTGRTCAGVPESRRERSLFLFSRYS